MNKVAIEIIKENLAIWFKLPQNSKLDKVFRELSSKERKILEYRYKYGMCWDFIPEKVKFSRTHCFRVHNKALDKIHKFLKEN